MIQKVAINRFGTHASAAPSARHAVPDDPNVWTQGSGTKTYSLDVVQHPIRARMCGFGDKDRRPLAPAAVAKMIVRNPDGSLVEVDDIDYSFFVVTVDLWSSDCKQEMNLVLHPSSSDRRTGASGSAAASRSDEQSPAAEQSPLTPSAYSARHPNDTSQPTASNGSASYLPSTSTPGYNATNSQLPYQPQSAPQEAQVPGAYHHENPYAPDPWGYANQTHPSHPTMERAPSQNQYTPSLPSIHTFGRNPATTPTSANGNSWQPDHRHEPNGSGTQSTNSFRQWPTATDPGNFSSEHASHATPVAPSAIDPALRTNGSTALPPPPTSDMRETSSWGHPPPLPDAYPAQSYAQSTTPNAAPGYDNQVSPVLYASASAAYSQNTHASSAHAQYQAPYPPNPAPAPPPAVPLPRHTYTRTLVGPLAANASRLLDENRRPGIFFLFQDLSIRTEGTFRLRLRLMNIGAPPAPDHGSLRVHTTHSPILAQTFTDPFTVFSAKRFPGVPDTTPLSIAFGNQGQKLPLRNRNGPSKNGRKRRRGGGSEGSDDDSDD
ncbi:hypothetical protein OE88DRAFT_639058 [Heliocybe sulcata]|uniref:Velvet domain-containing protein n=1 Tax=Heliocybe sulcata TaxID=5364 RepID=A0A5C3NF49_9AGAM|nr:hypothetical protein OE88DRAFT_639058 [Heliocybe sulcata]